VEGGGSSRLRITVVTDKNEEKSVSETMTLKEYMCGVSNQIIEEAMKAVKESGRQPVSDAVYELYLSKEAVRDTNDVSGLDARLAVLEKVVGSSNPADRRVLSAPTDDKSLVEAVKLLDGRKTLLNQQHIDHVEGRLSALTFKVNSIGEQKGALEAASKEDKLNRLSSLVASQSSLAAGLLPQILERVQQVSQLQEGSKSWQDVVDSVEQQQRESKDVIADTEKEVVSTKEYFDNNLAGIHENFTKLQKKLQQIKA